MGIWGDQPGTIMCLQKLSVSCSCHVLLAISLLPQCVVVCEQRSAKNRFYKKMNGKKVVASTLSQKYVLLFLTIASWTFLTKTSACDSILDSYFAVYYLHATRTIPEVTSYVQTYIG